MISKEQWIDWKRHPVTMYFLQAISDKREQIKEGIAEGQSGMNLNRDIGRAQGLKDVLRYALVDFDYVVLDDKLEEQDGTESSGVSSITEG